MTLTHTSTDTNGKGDGSVHWFELAEDWGGNSRDMTQVVGLHSGGSFVDCDGVTMDCVGDFISAAAERAMRAAASVNN